MVSAHRVQRDADHRQLSSTSIRFLAPQFWQKGTPARLWVPQRGQACVRIPAAVWWPRRSRLRDFEVLRFGTAMTSSSVVRNRALARSRVQVSPATGAEPGAAGPAQRIGRHRQRQLLAHELNKVDLRGTLRIVRGVPGLLALIGFACFNMSPMSASTDRATSDRRDGIAPAPLRERGFGNRLPLA
jgi:hypothetical protein